jgi:hypothetical protein
MSATTQENKAEILGEFWLNHKDDTNFEEFISYNDLGLPLAYAISMNIIKATELSDKLVNETFTLLLASFEVEDEGFENLEDIFILAGNS